MRIDYLKPALDTVRIVTRRLITTSTDSIFAPTIEEDEDTVFSSF